MLRVFLFLLSLRTVRWVRRAHWSKSKVYFCTSELQQFNKRAKKRKHFAILFICFSCWCYFPITCYSCWFSSLSPHTFFVIFCARWAILHRANKMHLCAQREQRITSPTMNMAFFHFSKLSLAAWLVSLALRLPFVSIILWMIDQLVLKLSQLQEFSKIKMV